MVFVATGTHHQPFDRLLIAVAAAATQLDEPFVVQRGCSRVELPGCAVHDTLPAAVFAAHLRSARAVVLHGGSSSFLEARALGRVPIVVPRRPEHREHVDDHQVRFAASLGTAAVVVEPTAMLEALRSHTDLVVTTDPDARSAAFGARLGALVDALLQ